MRRQSFVYAAANRGKHFGLLLLCVAGWSHAQVAEPSRSVGPGWILPHIEHTEGNPFLAEAIERGKREARDVATYDEENPLTERQLDFAEAPAMVRLAELLCHPQSPMKDDPSLVEPLLHRLHAAVDSVLGMEGSKKKYSFSNRRVMRAYAILLTARPDLLPEDFRKRAEESFRVVAEDIIKRNPAFLQPDATGSWVNGDIRFAEALMWAGLLLEREHYREAGLGGLSYVARSFLGDGGFLYVGNVNETFTYHAANIEPLAHFHRFFHVPLAKELIVKSQAYYPLSIEPSGVAEYTTAACWKPYWNASVGSDGALIVADYTDCPLNKYVSELYTPASTFFLASFYRPDLEGRFHDNYMAYDYNIGGPRGRFGRFSFSGTAREYGTEYRGKGSFAGCMVVDAPRDAPGRPWNLNAALHEAGVEIRSQPASKGYERHSHHTSHGGANYYSISYDDKNGAAVSEDCAALGTVYRLSRYKAKGPQPCTGKQTWLFTPERLVGLLEIVPEADLEAYSLSATFKLVSGRAHWGERKVLTKEDNHYRYGKLNLVVHEQTFGSATTRYEDTYSGDAKKTARLSLLDEGGFAGKETTLQTYRKGERRYVLVEVYPDGNQAAEAIELQENGPSVKALYVAEKDGRRYRVYHNTTGQSLPVTSETRDGLDLVKNGARYRPAWLTTHEPGAARLAEKPERLKAGAHTIRIPAYGVALCELEPEAR